MLTPDEARALATDRLKDVAHGGDPSVDRHRAREALTVSELADLYLRDGPAEKPNKKASSWGADRSNIERHIKPLLSGKIAKSLTHVDIAKFQSDVAAGKSKSDIKTKKRSRNCCGRIRHRGPLACRSRRHVAIRRRPKNDRREPGKEGVAVQEPENGAVSLG